MTSRTFADTSNNAIRVSPALSNLQLSVGETSTTIVTTVTNLTSAPLVIDLSARDFGAQLSHPGAINFYDVSYNPNTNPHGLQTATSFSQGQLTLAPKESQKVVIVLGSLGQLAAGGHYGAVLFSPESLAASHAKTKVAIRSAVASLIFLKTASGGTQALHLLPFSISSLRFSLPTTNYVAFGNSGNTQTAPIGQLTLLRPNGTIASTEVLNPGSGLILPGTSRLFTINLPLSGVRLARPGVYKLVLQYRSGAQNRFTTVTRSFYYINLFIFFPVVVLLSIVIYLLKWHGSKFIRFAKSTVRRTSRQIKAIKSRPVKTQSEPVPEKKPKRKTPRVQG